MSTVKTVKTITPVRRPPLRRRPRPTITRNGRRRVVRTFASGVRNNVRAIVRRRMRPTLRGGNAPSVSTNPRRPQKLSPVGRITQSGFNFLKCAFAPPDFSNTGVTGVPDQFRGPTLLKKHRLVSQLALSAANDYYILLAPVPGFSVFTAAVATGTPIVAGTVFLGTPYSDFTNLFATPTTVADQVNSFRFISNHIEVISNNNQMTWSGNISVFKMPIKVSFRAAGVTSLADQIQITGLQSVNSTNANMYNGKLYDGAFSYAFSSSSTFNFCEILENLIQIPMAADTSDFGILGTTGVTVPIPGFDNGFETVLVKISGMNQAQSVTLKTWACVEYTPLDTSALYEYSNISPQYDAAAMAAYREIALSLPIAVPVVMNAGMWERVLRILRSITGIGSALPGSYGAISAGANMIVGGLQELTL